MSSLILRSATRYIFPLLLLVSIFLLLRGHNQPGGGFIAGLVAACGVVLLIFAWDLPRARRTIRVHPRSYVVAGLLMAVTAGCIGLVGGAPFLTGLWISLETAWFPTLKLGTPLLFDIGVFFVVFGISLTVVFSLASTEE